MIFQKCNFFEQKDQGRSTKIRRFKLVSEGSKWSQLESKTNPLNQHPVKSSKGQQAYVRHNRRILPLRCNFECDKEINA